MTTLNVTDTPKMLRETLCVAQVAIDDWHNSSRDKEHIDRLQRLIDECDRHRPLGPDGTHGDLHTATCRCDFAPNPNKEAVKVVARDYISNLVNALVTNNYTRDQIIIILQEIVDEVKEVD